MGERQMRQDIVFFFSEMRRRNDLLEEKQFIEK